MYFLPLHKLTGLDTDPWQGGDLVRLLMVTLLIIYII
jgi:hypothetical protein